MNKEYAAMIPSSLYCSACGAANATDRSVCFACQQPLRSVASEALLQGRYRILTQVGNGGFGAVYRAEDTHDFSKIVAIKQINLRGLTPQETIEATDAFNREVSLLSNLSHPNLPRIYDHFTDPEHWYLVMDFIEGETLESYLDAKGAHYTASLDEVLTLGMKLCTVLDYLHTREPSIIFRDLKPANIMRTAKGKLYLIDFGIARSFKPGKLKDTIPFGSPGYAAPEQYGKAQTTPRADIYSLGALLHMLLTGDDPVDNPFHFAPLRIYGALGLTELEALIMRMVHIDVQQRPTTIVEVQNELQHIAAMQPSTRIWHPPVGQTPPALSVIYPTATQQQISSSSAAQQMAYVPSTQHKRSSRRKFLVGGIAIAGLTIVGVGGITNIVSALNSHSAHLGMGVAQSVQGKPTLFGQCYTYAGQLRSVKDVVWSQRDAQLASASDDGTVQIWPKDDAFSAKTTPSNFIYNPPETVTCLAWGLGGSTDKLAMNNGKTIIIWDTIALDHRVVAAAPSLKGKDVSTAINTFAWSSPDGRSIAFPTSVGVQIWDSVSQDFSHIEFIEGRPLAENQTTSLSWSQDGKYIAVGILGNNETVILDAVEKRVAPRTQDIGGGGVTWSPDGKMLATVDGSVVNISSRSDDGISFTASCTLLNKVTALAWSPTSRFLAIAMEGTSENLYLWNLFANPTDTVPSPSQVSMVTGATNATTIDVQDTGISSLAWSYDSRYLAIGTHQAVLLEVDTSVLSS